MPPDETAAASQESKPPVIEIDRGPWRAALRFHSPQDVANFLDQEQIIWGWTKGTLGGILEQAISQHRDNWISAVKTQVEAWRGDPEYNLGTLRGQLQARFVEQGRLSAIDPEAHAISEIAKINPRAGAAALLVVQGRGFEIDQNTLMKSPDVRVGQAKGLAILAGAGPETISGIIAAQKAAVQALDRKSSSLSDEISNLKTSAQRALEEFGTRSADIIRRLDDTFLKSHENWNSDATGLRTELQTIAKTYETQMQLRGPVRNWQSRAIANRNWSFFVLGLLITFSVTACYLLYQLFEHAASLLPQPGQELEYAKLFRASAFSLLMTTIAAWIAKVMLRVYFSLRHLATDAAERMTMTMTFLALLRGKSISEDDKKLILQALFRPASDGIVKDDFSIDPGAAGIIGTLLKR